MEKLTLFSTEPHPCSYLTDEQSETLFVDPFIRVDRSQYSQLSQLGFRRSGSYLYRPNCANCSACIPTRIPVTLFNPSRSQKRTLKKCRDMRLCITEPQAGNEEHYQLYKNYINARHADGDMYPPSREQFASFLTVEGFDTFLMEFRLNKRLVAVAVTDRLDDGLSAIYSYFDPELPKLGLGVLCLLKQIEQVAHENGRYLYIGYWVKGCQKMAYKLDYRPAEVLVKNKWMLMR